MTSLLLALLLTQSPPKTHSRPGQAAPYVVNIQGSASGTPIPISGTVNSAGAADTVGTTAALGALNATCSVALAGQGGAGMFLAAGTLAATLTPELSTDNGTTWTATSFIDKDGTKSSTLAFTNPSSATQTGIVVLGGARRARVRVSSYTSGTADCTLVATTATSAGAAAAGGGSATQYDEDTVSADAEKLNMMGAVRRDTAASSAATDGDRVTLNTDASGRLWVNASGAAVPVTDNGGSLTVDGTVTVTDGAGSLNVIVDSSALPSGAATAAKQPALGTAGAASADVMTIQGVASMTPLQVADNGGSLTVDGTVTVTDGAGALNVIVDSGSVTVGAALPAGTNNIGDVDVLTLPGVTGAAATDAVVSGNPVYVGAYAESEGAALSSVSAEGDVSPLKTDLQGRLLVASEHPNKWSAGAFATTATTLTELKAAPGAGVSLYVTDVVFSSSAASTTTTDQQLLLKRGTGTNCGTGTATVWAAFNPANGGAVATFSTPIKLPANEALCFIAGAAGTKHVLVNGFIAP